MNWKFWKRLPKRSSGNLTKFARSSEFHRLRAELAKKRKSPRSNV